MALSLPSLLGLLLLIGIVFANAILLVDFATKARDDYDDLDEAVVAAGRARLRPILMTALATLFALLSLALGLAGGGSELVSSSLALTVIGGLRPRPFSRCSSSRSATPCSKAAPLAGRRGGRGEARAQARAGPSVLQADRGRLLLEPPEPRRGTQRVVRERNRVRASGRGFLSWRLGLVGSGPRAAPTCCGAIFVVNAVVTSPP